MKNLFPSSLRTGVFIKPRSRLKHPTVHMSPHPAVDLHNVPSLLALELLSRVWECAKIAVDAKSDVKGKGGAPAPLLQLSSRIKASQFPHLTWERLAFFFFFFPLRRDHQRPSPFSQSQCGGFSIASLMGVGTPCHVSLSKTLWSPDWLKCEDLFVFLHQRALKGWCTQI